MPVSAPFGNLHTDSPVDRFCSAVTIKRFAMRFRTIRQRIRRSCGCYTCSTFVPSGGTSNCEFSGFPRKKTNCLTCCHVMPLLIRFEIPLEFPSGKPAHRSFHSRRGGKNLSSVRSRKWRTICRTSQSSFPALQRLVQPVPQGKAIYRIFVDFIWRLLTQRSGSQAPRYVGLCGRVWGCV